MKLKTYTFEDAESGLRHIVFARDEEAAQKIIDVANELSPFQFILIKDYVKMTDTPFTSYDLVERVQLETEKEYLEHRKSRLN